MEEATGEAHLFVCEEAWGRVIEELERDYLYPEEPVMGDDWTTAEELAQEYPELYGEFRGEENVRTLARKLTLTK